MGGELPGVQTQRIGIASRQTAEPRGLVRGAFFKENSHAGGFVVGDQENCVLNCLCVMKHLQTVSLTILTFCIGGCGSSSDILGATTVGASPDDGTTGLGAFSVTLSVIPARGMLSVTDRSDLLRGLSIVSLPDSVPVTSRVSVNERLASGQGPNGNPVGNADTFQVSADDPLPEGWYAAEFSTLPTTFVWPDAFDHYVGPDGLAVTRVHIGSLPSLWGVEMCTSDPTSSNMSIIFTEPVMLVPGSVLPVAVNMSNIKCSAVNDLSVASQFTKLLFRCSGSSLTGTLEVTIGDGLVSLTGVPVATNSLAIDVERLSNARSGCPTYKEPVHPDAAVN